MANCQRTVKFYSLYRKKRIGIEACCGEKMWFVITDLLLRREFSFTKISFLLSLRHDGSVYWLFARNSFARGVIDYKRFAK